MYDEEFYLVGSPAFLLGPEFTFWDPFGAVGGDS